ncbi:MAG: ribosome maturation factor RimP [Selenomonadaceae bacterium]|nr:ribosome maturation factor RimP [Selenomonadaceae bacterium]
MRPLFHIIGINFGGDSLSKIETQVEEIMTEILTGTEYELVDVEYVKERDWYLRVFVDKAEGIDLEDCQMLSEKLGAKLDETNIISGAYILEVSSPGIDRILKKDRDFIREIGKKVDVTLYAPIDGQKSFVGELQGRDENFLHLKDIEPLPRDKVATVRLHIDF